MKRDKRIKPCPFCGSEELTTGVMSRGEWFVSCMGCGAYGPEDNLRDEEAAIEAWNVGADLRLRVQELEKDLKDAHWLRDELTKTIEDLGFGRAKAKIEKLEKALAFYADEENWSQQIVNGSLSLTDKASNLWNDKGQIAREALGVKGEGHAD